MHKYTLAGTQVYTDEWNGYNHIIRPHATACHAKKEWARDDDVDGIREVHVNTVAGMWTDVCNYLRPFKGVHKDYLSGYVAMAEFRRNLKRVSPAFISSIVKVHTFDRQGYCLKPVFSGAIPQNDEFGGVCGACSTNTPSIFTLWWKQNAEMRLPCFDR